MDWLENNEIYRGDCRELIKRVPGGSAALAVARPPVPRSADEIPAWREMMSGIAAELFRALRPGGFMALLCPAASAVEDPSMPRVMAECPSRRRCPVTREDAAAAAEAHPGWSRRRLAAELGCSEQTVLRRLSGNGLRGGRMRPGTRLFDAGAEIAALAEGAGLALYDIRYWLKGPTPAARRRCASTLRCAPEAEAIRIFWKPGPYTVDKGRLSGKEWASWGRSQAWSLPGGSGGALERIIRIFAGKGDLVLDPFAGDGDAAIAALASGRDFICFEKSARRAREAMRRIENYNPLF